MYFMKTLQLLLLVLTITILKFSPAHAQLLIEDFEDGNTTNSLGGYWYIFNDNSSGGKSRLEQNPWQKTAFVTSGGYESLGMLDANVILEKAGYQWAPYYAFATSIEKSSKVNPKNYAGISYWHKGVAHTFRVDIPEVKDYDNHQISVPCQRCLD